MSVQCPAPRTCVHKAAVAAASRGLPQTPRRRPWNPEALLLCTVLSSQGPGVQKFQGPGRSRHMGSGTLLRRGDRLRKNPQGFLRVAPKWA